MSKSLSRISTLIALVSIVVLGILGCSPQATPTPETTTALEPTATQVEVVPTAPKNSEELVVFSLEEDGYAHLFMYVPEKMPLTRITSGDWDDITPAPSPDGQRIAFASNRSGFWDLYLLDLKSGEFTQLTNTPEYEGAPTWSPDGTFMAFEAYQDRARRRGPRMAPLWRSRPIRMKIWILLSDLHQIH